MSGEGLHETQLENNTESRQEGCAREAAGRTDLARLTNKAIMLAGTEGDSSSSFHCHTLSKSGHPLTRSITESRCMRGLPYGDALGSRSPEAQRRQGGGLDSRAPGSDRAAQCLRVRLNGCEYPARDRD